MYNITTWEQMRRHQITYLKHYPPGFNPFDLGFANNMRAVFLHGNAI